MKKRQCYKICELIGSDTSKIIGDNTVGESSYISTGFVNLDELLLLNGGDVISIGGRPGMGKTALALNIAENIAIHNKLPVIIFSLESTVNTQLKRLISSVARVDSRNISTGEITAAEVEKISIAINELKNAPIHIIDSIGITIFEICEYSRFISEKYKKVGLIVVDYIQLIMNPNEDMDVVRAQEISFYTRMLKHLAMEINVPILIVSEINRDVESRTDKRPKISDFRDSGSIEEDSDSVLLIYRDEYYNPYESKEKGLAEINIAKNRNGSTGTIKLAFLNQYTRFDSLVYQW